MGGKDIVGNILGLALAMGVRRLFSRGGQNFSRGGQEPTFCLKTMKKILFFPKKSKNILFLAGFGRPGGWGGGVQEPLCPPPADAHGFVKVQFFLFFRSRNYSLNFVVFLYFGVFLVYLFAKILPKNVEISHKCVLHFDYTCLTISKNLPKI